MVAFPSPLAEDVSFKRSSGGDVSSGTKEYIPQEQYPGQWGEDWIGFVEQVTLKYEERFYQNAVVQQRVGPLLFRPEASSTDQTGESVEMRWLVDHSSEVEQHKGEWLLIHGAELVAHHHDFSRIRAVVTERRIRSPFVYYVPTDDESNSITI